jgi:lysophospholipase L1-like esterase
VAEAARAATGRLFERNLSTIVRLIRSTGAVPVVSNIPIKPEGQKNRGTYYGAAFDAARRNNAIAGAVAEAEGAAFVDLDRMMNEPAGFVDSIHLNEVGMRAKADALFPVVREVLVQRAPSGS